MNSGRGGILAGLEATATRLALLLYVCAALATPAFIADSSTLIRAHGLLQYAAFLLLWGISFLVLNFVALARVVKRKSDQQFDLLTLGQGFSIILSMRFVLALWGGTAAIARNPLHSSAVRVWAFLTRYVGAFHVAAVLILLLFVIIEK